jgi:hypothetical protein
VGGYLGVVDDELRYGPYFLSDLMPAFGYTEAGIVGKLALYVHLASTGATALRLAEQEHCHVDAVGEGTLLAREEPPADGRVVFYGSPGQHVLF